MTVASSSPVLRVGVVGAGRAGSIHITNLLNTRFVDLVAVLTLDPKEQKWVKEIAPDVVIYTSYDEFIKTNVDAVVISSPTVFHKEQVFKALENGKHVFCEKPLGMDPQGAWEVYNESLKYPHLKVACGFPRRYAKVYSEAARRIREGEIGEVYAIKTQIADLYDPSPEFGSYIKHSGGIFVDSCVHCIDSCLYLIGKDEAPTRAFAMGTTRVFPHFAEWKDVDNGLGLVDFGGKIVCSFFSSRDNFHGHHSMSEVFGTKGRILINGDPRVLNIDISDSTGTRMIGARSQMELFSQGFVDEMNAFRDWILFDKEPFFNLKDAAKAVSIGKALQESLISGLPTIMQNV